MLSADDVGRPMLGSGRHQIADAIASTDFVRRSPASVGRRGGHKEWQHFAILAPEVDLLVNFSLCDDARPGTPAGQESPRVVVLARTAAGWDGDVESFGSADAVVRGGGIDLSFLHNRLYLDREGFHISVALRARPVRAELRLEPVSMPAFVPSIPMLEGPPLNWVVVPRLAVSGTLTVGGRTQRLDGALAYHDHNWGRFQWGHDVAWEWGFVLPDDSATPWCLTFVRLTNRARTLALAHKLLLWRGPHLVRVFRESEINAEVDLACLRLPQVAKYPRPLALVAPELFTDVPARVTTRGRADDDWLDCHCEAFDLAQVLIPSETEIGVTIFNEVSARAAVRGVVGGESVAFSGRAIMEFIRYV